MLFIVVFFTIFYLRRSQQVLLIQEDNTFPITTSSTNAGDYSDYIFLFSTNINITTSCQISIQFPASRYRSGLGISFTPTVQIQSKSQQITSPANFINQTVIISNLNLLAGPQISLKINQVLNPNQIGGTGCFQTLIQCGGQTSSSNQFFSGVGINNPKVQLAFASINFDSGVSQNAGTLSNYILTIRPSTDLSTFTVFSFVFPIGFNFTNLAQIQTDYPSKNSCFILQNNVTQFMPSGNFKCKFTNQINEIQVQGFNATVPKNSTLVFQIVGAINPPQQLTSGFVSVRAFLNNTNQTFEFNDYVPSIFILPGILSSVSLITVLSTPLVPNSQFDFILSFLPTNPFNTIRIVTRFRNVIQCFSISSLIPLNQIVSCITYSNIIEITNFIQYKRIGKLLNDQVQIQFTAITTYETGTLLPCEIYTYTDNTFTQNVDQNTNALLTTLIIALSPPIQSLTTFTSSSTIPGGQITITGNIVPLQNYTSPTIAQFDISFPTLYTLGLSLVEGPQCYYTSFYQYETGFVINSIIYQGFVNCTISPTSNSVLHVELTSAGIIFPLLVTNPTKTYLTLYNSIVITKIINPKIANNFPISVTYSIKTNPTPLETYNFIASVSLPAPAISVRFSTVYKNRLSLLTVSFLAPFAFDPSNQSQFNYYESFTRIGIKFFQLTGLNPSWSNNLGLTQTQNGQTFDCWAFGDLKPIGKLDCYLFLGNSNAATLKSTDYTFVLIKNYNLILINGVVSFSFFVQFPNQTSNPSIQLEIYQIQKGIQLTLFSTVASCTLCTLPIAYPTTPPSFTSFSQLIGTLNPEDYVNIIFTLSPSVSALKSENPVIMVQIPTGWNVPSNSGQIFLDGIQIFYPYFLFDALRTIMILQLQNNFSSGNHILSLNGFFTQTGAALSNNIQIDYFKNYQLIGSRQAIIGGINTFQNNIANFTSILQKSIMSGDTYSIQWITAKTYNNSQIQISFPSAFYNFDSTLNYNIQFMTNNTQVEQNLYTLSISPNSFILTFSNFLINIGTFISLNISAITNPIAIPVSNFVINVLSNSWSYSQGTYQTQTEQINFQMPKNFISIENPIVPYNAYIMQISAFPSNSNFQSRLKFILTFQISLPINSNILLQMSSGISILNTLLNPQCFASGALFKIGNCVPLINGNIIIISFTLFEPYNALQKLQFDLVGYSILAHPQGEFQSFSDFQVSAMFGNSIIAQSSINSVNPLIIYPQPLQIFPSVNLTIFPRNEGEISTYNFTVKAFTQQITSDMLIWIRLPIDYDINISTFMRITSNLTGALKFSLSLREIIIWGFYSQNLPNPLTINIYGIINPNMNGNTVTGTFCLGLMSSSNQIIESNCNIPGLLFTIAPQILSVLQKQLETLQMRTINRFQFVLSSDVLFSDGSNGGLIQVLYPQNYIMDSFPVVCSTQNTFSLFSSCKVTGNIIQIISTNSVFNTNTIPLQLSLKNIRNPEEAGITGNIYLYSMNTKEGIVLSRNFPNLGTTSDTFFSSYLDIKINEDIPITLTVGSFSDPITVAPFQVLKQSINIIPIYYDSLFLFDRNPLYLQKSKPGGVFRFAAPQNMLLTRFYITWSKSGDLNPTFYNPIRKTAVDIVKGNILRNVSIEGTPYINRNGTSVPMAIKTNNPPYDFISLSIGFLNNMAQGVILNNSSSRRN